MTAYPPELVREAASAILRDEPWPPVNRIGPRKLTAAALIHAIPSLMRQFHPVPEDYYYTHSEGGVIVDCPCGERPHVEDLKLCACERAYYFGKALHVAGGPKAMEAAA